MRRTKMSFVVVYNSPIDGHMSELYPNLDSGLTLKEIIAKDVPTQDYTVFHANEMPKITSYAASWKYDCGKIYCDVSKAHNIHKNIWREKRKNILERLDVEFMKALENEDQQKIAEIKSKKKILRDITQTELPEWKEEDTVDTFSERLQNVQPECLSW